MSGHKSFSKVVVDYIDNHQWPKDSDKSQSILAVSKKDASCGTVFEFQSAFTHLKIHGIYHKGHNALIDVHIQLVAPGHHKGVNVAEAESYHISTAEGKPISFDLDNGYVKGSVSFKYGSRGGRQDIFATYKLRLPCAKDQNETVDIAPTEVTNVTGFTDAQLQEIAHFTLAEFEDVEKKAKSSSKIGEIQTLNGVSGHALTDEQELLVKFLKDFVVDEDSVVVATYYPNTSATNLADNYSNQWRANVSFLGVLEVSSHPLDCQYGVCKSSLQLAASVDPKKLGISATLEARVPIIGRVHLVETQGSLIDGEGVTAKLDVLVAQGKVTFSAAKNLQRGKYDLYAEAELDIKHLHAIKSNGKSRIAALPF